MGDDPTVVALEREVAALFEKEAGLFVPSGTMGNLLAVCTWCEVRGSEFVVGRCAHALAPTRAAAPRRCTLLRTHTHTLRSAAHIHIYEQGGVSSLGGVHPRVVANAPDGTMDLAEIEACVRPDDVHFAQLRLVCMEARLCCVRTLRRKLAA